MAKLSDSPDKFWDDHLSKGEPIDFGGDEEEQ